MTTIPRARLLTAGWLIAGGLAASSGRVPAQPPASPQAPPTGVPFDASKVPAGLAAPKMWTAQQDHQDMMDQLGIKALRPGPSGTETAPNHANYDESLANPYPNLPDVLALKNGKKVTSAATWTERRREIVEDFDREVLGRVPKSVPKVTWTVTRTIDATVAGHAAAGKALTGHVDNSAYPAIDVDIQMTLVTPKDARGPVPVMMMFGGGRLLPGDPAPAGFGRGGGPGFGPPAGGDPPATEQLIAGGWGYASIRGAAHGLDYLETDRTVDAKKVGIEGVSRYGKAALVTMAYDTRFAVVLIGSSGEGGAKLHRRNWGEAVENLTGSGEYHWMAGNFLKYGAADATFGSRNAGEIPVDAHELIALCAPRLTFVSYGVPEKGDAKWLDQQGSFMATIAAQPVFRLLGARDLGRSDDYKTEKMPAVNAGLLDGQLAWRQHDGGHTDGPNWKYFIPWADIFLAHPPPSPADRPAPRTDQSSITAHNQLLDKAKHGGIDVYFLGDSITRRWGATDYPAYLANWKENFFGWNAADFGWGADRIENMLWRLDNGELDEVNPKVVVILAGTNNVGTRPGGDAKIAEITRGIAALGAARRRHARPIPRRERQARGQGRETVRRDDERGRSAPVTPRLPGVGRCAEAPLHRDSWSAGGDRSRAAADGRSECARPRIHFAFVAVVSGYVARVRSARGAIGTTRGVILVVAGELVFHQAALRCFPRGPYPT